MRPPSPPCPVALSALIAQADAPRAEPQPLEMLVGYLPLILIGITAYLLLFKPERERVKQQQSLLAGLKKNDRVVTSSGIYGTVANVERDADRVSLKVDDAANVKITVTLASIARVLADREGEGGDGAS